MTVTKGDPQNIEMILSSCFFIGNVVTDTSGLLLLCKQHLKSLFSACLYQEAHLLGGKPKINIIWMVCILFSVTHVVRYIDTATNLLQSRRHARSALKVWGTNYFSFFVSYRFMSNKTQLTEFPESKSDMPLFLWVLALK